MKFLRHVLLSFLISSQAFAGLPPTTSKGVGDASNKVTFNYLFPGNAISHTGVSATVLPPSTALPNFIGQTTTWTPTNTDDRDLETSIGNWLAFADAAAATPVDLTGGSPTVTCTRSTTDPMDGAASLLVTTDAANRQGEGCSVVFNVQPAYQGATVTITAPLRTVSGSLVQGDWKFFIYDVTNSVLITPYNNDIVSGPSITATFPTTARAATPANQQYRLGIYRASSNATANVLQLDNLSVSPSVAAYGLAGSNWTAFTPTGAWSANTTYTGFYRRVGDTLEMKGTISTSGAPTSANATVNLPTGLTIDTAKLTSTAALVSPIQGTVVAIDAAAANYWVQAYYSTTTAITFRKDDGDGTIDTTVTQAAPFTFGAGDSIDFHVTGIPITGWDSNVSMAQSSTFQISSFLANGSRVTGSAPTVLGQYRSYLRNNSANTFTETNGNPTAVPTVADGAKIYRDGAWAAGSSVNSPTRYEIFVGKNKQIKWNFYAAAARTGFVDVTQYQSTATSVHGYATNYDPTTGIAAISVPANSASTGNPDTGTDGTGARINTAVFFDITVSENALAVATEAAPYAEYTTNTATAFTGATVLPFEDKVSDSHGSSYNTSTGIFTAPQSGTYQVSAAIVTTSVAWTAGNQLQLMVYKGGALYRRMAVVIAETTASYRLGASGSISIRMSAGETLAIYASASVATALEGTTETNWMSIARVGN